jgi:uncharacterized phage protein (TIGR02218 family)
VKVLSAALLAHYALDATTMAYGLDITRPDGRQYGFTSHDKAVTIGGLEYSTSRNIEITAIKHTSGLGVGNLELVALNDGTLFTTPDVLNGIWRNSRYRLFRYNWASPPSGSPESDAIDIRSVGVVGEVQLGEERTVAELRDLRQFFQQTVGEPFQKNCRARLGDANCRVDLGSPNNFTELRAVAAVTSNQVFSVAGLYAGGSPNVENWYADGEVAWIDGDNAGATTPVKASSVGGVITLKWPMWADIQAGDRFTITAGCDKTRDGDNGCRKFNNVLNYYGEPDAPGVDDLTQPVSVSV